MGKRRRGGEGGNNATRSDVCRSTCIRLPTYDVIFAIRFALLCGLFGGVKPCVDRPREHPGKTPHRTPQQGRLQKNEEQGLWYRGVIRLSGLKKPKGLQKAGVKHLDSHKTLAKSSRADILTLVLPCGVVLSDLGEGDPASNSCCGFEHRKG